MKSNNYVVKRKDIYVGVVSCIYKEKIKIFETGIYDLELSTKEEKTKKFDNRKYMLVPKEQLLYGNGSEIDGFNRSMLFVLDEQGCANDLLYDSPHYPIFNISSNDLCLNASIGLCNYIFEMGEFLKVFGYGENLTYDDILEIKDKFFGDFMIANCELLGRYETDPESTGYETYDMQGNHHTFNLIKEDSLLPDCYFSMLWHTRNKKNNDVFIPSELEGPIKKLGQK